MSSLLWADPSFLHLTNCNEGRQAFHGRSPIEEADKKRKKKVFRSQKICWDDLRLDEIGGRRSGVKVWRLLLIEVLLSGWEGGFIPVFPTLNLAYCFSFLLRLKGIISWFPPPNKHIVILWLERQRWPFSSPFLSGAVNLWIQPHFLGEVVWQSCNVALNSSVLLTHGVKNIRY